MSNPHSQIVISDDTRVYIIDELIEPYYKNVVKNTLQGRQCWRRTGITFETISKIMVAFGSILSFSAGVYQDQTLSFVSGSISCLSLAFLQFSSFSYKENKKQSEELNILLKKLGLETIPVLDRESQQPNTIQQQISQREQSYYQSPQQSFTLPFDLSMISQLNSENKEAKEAKENKENKTSMLSKVNSQFDSYNKTITNVQSTIKDTILELKDEILDDTNLLSNNSINVSINSKS
jgi:hypothetical protein